MWHSFFFSSRRRHTRYWRDWSSDVCSSDLRALVEGRRVEAAVVAALRAERDVNIEQIGRASCRERVQILEVGGFLKINGVNDDREVETLRMGIREAVVALRTPVDGRADGAA